MSRRSSLSCGRDFYAVRNVEDALATAHDASDSKCDFITIPIVHPRYRRVVGEGAPSRSGLFTRSDMVLSANEWTKFVVGKISAWIDPGSDVEAERINSEHALRQELMWATHLSLPAVQFNLTSYNCANSASLLNQFLGPTCALLFWISVPLCAPRPPDAADDDDYEGTAAADPWEWWNRLRSLCRPSPKLAVALELTADLPSPTKLGRWLGEPVRAVIVPTHVFLRNKKGYPVLPKAHQAVIKRLLKFDPQFVIKGNVAKGGFAPYLKYLQHLHTTQPDVGVIAKFAAGYEDYLQAPLQPLMDNLESNTYETFEKDPIKYKQYQLAVKQALLDRVPPEQRSTVVSVVMVVGAGRGPLVQCAKSAAEEAGCKVKLYAIEKNPNAVVTLEARNERDWDGCVTVVSTDMRDWKTEIKADIMVSELLGSFGDNELSPECLDGAQAFLADGGISIPSDSTSFMTPLSAHKLHTELLNATDAKKQLQTPFVVMLHNVRPLAEIKKVFYFEHPNPDNGTTHGPDNSRYAKLSFTADQASTMHGFAGYFESTLYKDTIISINPATHSPGMFSWFPIYFPVMTPIYVKEGDQVEAHIWRKTNGKKVWYEWCVTSPVTTKIHNASGESYYIGL